MFLQAVFTAAVAWAAAFYSLAQAQHIYTCVDGQGRRITSDRSIPECNDRAQQQLSKSGFVTRQVEPSLTTTERAEQDKKERLAAETRARATDEKSRNRALLLRYPGRFAHDRERALAIAQLEENYLTASQRLQELAQQRKTLNAEMEFYARDPAKAPLSLRRRLEDNESSTATQQKFMAEQELEKKRVNLRFDEELNRLQQLWALSGALKVEPDTRVAGCSPDVATL